MKSSILLSVAILSIVSTSSYAHSRDNPFAKVVTTPLIVESVKSTDSSAPNEFLDETKKAVQEALKTKKLLSDNSVTYNQLLDRVEITIVEYHPSDGKSNLGAAILFGVIGAAIARDPATKATVEIISGTTNETIYSVDVNTNKTGTGRVAKDLAQDIQRKLAFKLKIKPVQHTAKNTKAIKVETPSPQALKSSKEDKTPALQAATNTKEKQVDMPAQVIKNDAESSNSNPAKKERITPAKVKKTPLGTKERLKKLKELHEEGLISDEEYKAGRKDALDGIL